MTNMNFTVDRDRCIKCGLCKQDCIVKIIEYDNEGIPYITNEKDCIKCQHCFSICPKGAISIFNKNPDKSFICNQIPNADQVEHLIKSRRSYRLFKEDAIDSNTMHRLKDILNWTPTGVNYRDLHFSIVENPETMEEIKKSVYKSLIPALKLIPVPKRFKKYKKLIINGEDVVFRNAPHMIVVSANKNAPCKDIDPIISLSYFELYAQSMGIGTVWCGIATGLLPIFKNIMKKFDIPKTHKLSYVMLLGYPKYKYSRSIQPEKYEITSI